MLFKKLLTKNNNHEKLHMYCTSCLKISHPKINKMLIKYILILYWTSKIPYKENVKFLNNEKCEKLFCKQNIWEVFNFFNLKTFQSLPMAS